MGGCTARGKTARAAAAFLAVAAGCRMGERGYWPQAPASVASGRVVVGTCYAAAPAGDGDGAHHRVAAFPAEVGGGFRDAPIAGGAHLELPAVRRVAKVSLGLLRLRDDPAALASLQRALGASRPRFTQCYAHRLQSDPNLAGTLRADLDIDPSGRVERVEVVRGLQSRSVNLCVARVLDAIHLPALRGAAGARAHLGLSFRSIWRGSRPPAEEVSPRPAPRPCGAPLYARLLAAERGELQQCYQQALRRNPELSGRLMLRVGRHAGIVPGGDFTVGAASEFRDCVVAAMRRIDLAPGAVCSLSLQNPRTSEIELTGAKLEILLSEVRLEGSHVMETISLEAADVGDDVGEPLVSAVRALFPASAAPVPVTIRAYPGVDSGVVGNVLALLAQSDRITVWFGRAIGITDNWEVVNPEGSPDYGVCEPSGASVAVRVSSAGIAIATADLERFVPARGDRHDFAGYGRTLARLRQGPLGQASDLVIAAEPKVPYRVLLRALEVAVGRGFFDARVVRHDRLGRSGASAEPLSGQPRAQGTPLAAERAGPWPR